MGLVDDVARLVANHKSLERLVDEILATLTVNRENGTLQCSSREAEKAWLDMQAHWKEWRDNPGMYVGPTHKTTTHTKPDGVKEAFEELNRVLDKTKAEEELSRYLDNKKAEQALKRMNDASRQIGTEDNDD